MVVRLEGYRVETAANGDAGLADAKEVQPALVIVNRSTSQWMELRSAVDLWAILPCVAPDNRHPPGEQAALLNRRRHQ